MKYQKIVFIFLILNLSSCFYRNEHPNQELTLYSHNKFKYALPIMYRVEGRGNIHSLSISSYEYDDADWIYTDQNKGIVSATNLIFTHYQDKVDSPWKLSKIKGTVTFDSLTVKIDLMFPEYDQNDSVKNWVPYQFNGKYALRISDEQPPKIDP